MPLKHQKYKFMELKEFKDKVQEITSDKSLSIDDRIEKALELIEDDSTDNADVDDEEEEGSRKGEYECNVYSALTEMLKGDHSRDLTLLQLYTLLAETLEDMDRYRDLGAVAKDVLALMRDELTPADIYKDTIPRIASAIGASVYNHYLYEIMLRYIRCALMENPDDESVKPLAKKLLKLHLLLKDPDWCSYLWNNDLQDAIARLFTSEELIKIMRNPKIGHLRKDPVEYTWEWEDIYYDVEDKIDERFMNAPRQMGLCFRIWSAKRELLKEEYGIEWKSPAQMNPRVRFD